MAKLIFYRQKRRDGGLRTAVEAGEETLFGLFEEGESNDDPTLRWFVDLRCEGAGLPQSPRAARTWLLKHADMISDGFARCADEIAAGIDPDHYPLSWDRFGERPEGVTMKLVCSATRRVDAIEMASVLREIGSNWRGLLRMLKPPVPASHR